MKKQFRLYDIYRKASLDKQSAIQGVLEYTVEIYHTIDKIDISVTFYDYEMFEDSITIDANTEAELKKFVKRVNKKLKIAENLARSLKSSKKTIKKAIVFTGPGPKVGLIQTFYKNFL